MKLTPTPAQGVFSCGARVLMSFATIVVLAQDSAAQGSRLDYERAAQSGRNYTKNMHPFSPRWHWLDGGAGVWFSVTTDGKTEYTLVESTGKKHVASRREDLHIPARSSLSGNAKIPDRSQPGGESTQVTIKNETQNALRLLWLDLGGKAHDYGEIAAHSAREQQTYGGHCWKLTAADGRSARFQAGDAPETIVLHEESLESPEKPASSPAAHSPSPELFIANHNVVLRTESGEPIALSTDGTAAHAYQVPSEWSPDHTRVAGFQVTPAQEHMVYLLSSSPKDQLQPKLVSHNYLKPGDEILKRQLRIFNITEKRQIPVPDEPFADAWSVDQLHWSVDGSEVYCLYNRRGHQLLRILAVNAVTGAVRTVVEERSNTFIDYSQKTWIHWLQGKDEFLWASERDGFNHLYFVDAKTGNTRAITQGRWMVRSVERVDEAAREIWFKALGIREGQDPYYSHLARIGLDGANLQILTEGDGTHEWTFSPDGTLFVDRWSRVDQPWVTELRRARDGSLIAELGRDDASALLATGWRPPVRFAAKGRDGKTDIYGIYYLPSNFDASRKYPVIEDIYAGPHDFFVPKRWGSGERQRRLAELGFVVVQIDGMGTNWRGKAFHDVCWRNLKDSGFPDRIAWMRELARTRPYIDLTRVGIFGGSAGGQSALAGLLHFGDFYKAGVADCGCHDNRMDKIWWNEAWMGYPVGPWYADNSNVTHASKLQGKLMLTVGELDRNVDPASTLQVVNALIAADKDFDFMLVPGAGHGVSETPWLNRRRQDFFVKNLLGVEPRREP